MIANGRREGKEEKRSGCYATKRCTAPSRERKRACKREMSIKYNGNREREKSTREYTIK